jgi:DNA-binding GntR family transcriptional regulator
MLELALIPATGEIMRELQVPLNIPVILIRRLRSINNIPVAVESEYHPQDR